MSNDYPAKDHVKWQIKPKESVEPTSSRIKSSGSVVPVIPSDIVENGSQYASQMNRFTQHALTNPFVPIGMAATVGCLIGMLKATLNRNQHRAQLYMRGRVAAQFVTVSILVGGALWMGFTTPFGSAPGVIPGNPDALTKKMLNRNSE